MASQNLVRCKWRDTKHRQYYIIDVYAIKF